MPAWKCGINMKQKLDEEGKFCKSEILYKVYDFWDFYLYFSIMPDGCYSLISILILVLAA